MISAKINHAPWNAISVVLLTVWFLGNASEMRANAATAETEPDAKKSITSGLTSLSKTLADGPGATVREPEQWWAERMADGGRVFWDACGDPDLEHNIEFYVNQFGATNSQTDLAWAFGEPDILLPDYRIDSGTPFKDDSPASAGMRRVRQLVCKYEVEMLLRDPKLLERYYRLTLWGGTLFGEKRQWTHFQLCNRDLRASFEGASKENYWLYARNFILLAHATARDDLVRGVAPTDLVAPYKKWSQWLFEGPLVSARLNVEPKKLIWYFDFQRTPTSEPDPIKVPDRPFVDWKRPLDIQFDELARHYYQDQQLRAKIEIVSTKIAEKK